MEINFVEFFFLNSAILVGVLGILINVVEPYLPDTICQFFRYGKHSHKGPHNDLIGKFEVPKSWFKHFYVFSFTWSMLGLFFTLKGFLTTNPAPEFLIDFLDFFAGGKNRPVLVNSTSSLIAMVLITLQCIRRFYETNFMQIFSSQSKINVSHYLVGYLHYFGAIIAILANTEGFVRGTKPSKFSFANITVLQYVCCAIFHFSWSQQYKSNRALVNLRKDQSGKKVTEKHLLPKGGFFDYVSSPHMLFEVLIYTSLAGIIPGSVTWKFVALWVIVNQFENAWLAHQWYKQNFNNYPSNRKAILPLIL